MLVPLLPPRVPLQGAPDRRGVHLNRFGFRVWDVGFRSLGSDSLHTKPLNKPLKQPFKPLKEPFKQGLKESFHETLNPRP